MSDSVTAFAPASIGNVAVGFDMLGLALANVGDRVSARRTDTPGVTLAEVRGIDLGDSMVLANSLVRVAASDMKFVTRPEKQGIPTHKPIPSAMSTLPSASRKLLT